MVREKKSPRYKKLGECLGMRGVEHGPRTGRYAEYRGWEDAHPGALIEVREPSVSAPVSAVVGVVTGAALAALPGRFRGTTQHSSAAVTGPGGGVPAFDVESDGRRLGGAPLRAAGRGRLLGGRHVKSDAGGAGHPKAMMSRRLEDLRSRRRGAQLCRRRHPARHPPSYLLLLEFLTFGRLTPIRRDDRQSYYFYILNVELFSPYKGRSQIFARSIDIPPTTVSRPNRSRKRVWIHQRAVPRACPPRRWPSARARRPSPAPPAPALPTRVRDHSHPLPG